MRGRVLWCVAVVSLSACGESGITDQTSCRVDSECPAGRYCSDESVCIYDCREDEDCRDPAMQCTERGRCEPIGGGDADTDSDVDGDTDSDADSDTDSDADGDTDSDADDDADFDPDNDADTDDDADADAECPDGGCIPCGDLDEPCCLGGTCGGGLRCTDGSCEACGGLGEPCCEGDACDGALYCDVDVCAGCDDDCDTPGGRECIDDTRFRACGEADDDPCLDWLAPGACDGSTMCDDGACIDCGGRSERCCPGGRCDAGLSCSGGFCDCEHTCAALGLAECTDATHYRTCGEHDLDPCREWSSPTWCGASMVCTGAGVCQHCGRDGERCCAGGTCDRGHECRDGFCRVLCGGRGQPCCADRACTGDMVCFNTTDTCGTDTTPTTTSYRFVSLCTSAHWQSVGNQCYPSSAGPRTGCGCESRTINAGCTGADSTCWRREISFHTYFFEPTYGDFFRIHHCYEDGANRYSRVGCASYGDPTHLGWIARSAEGPADLAVYLCEWVASGVTEHFFTLSAIECTSAGGRVVDGGPWGYVIP